jgi:hypothetical protein
MPRDVEVDDRGRRDGEILAAARSIGKKDRDRETSRQRHGERRELMVLQRREGEAHSRRKTGIAAEASLERRAAGQVELNTVDLVPDAVVGRHREDIDHDVDGQRRLDIDWGAVVAVQPGNL